MLDPYPPQLGSESLGPRRVVIGIGREEQEVTHALRAFQYTEAYLGSTIAAGTSIQGLGSENFEQSIESSSDLVGFKSSNK